MFKRRLPRPLIGALIFSLALTPAAPAMSKAESREAFAIKVKAGITKLGVGLEARLSVKLRDKTKLTGYVSQIGEDSFFLADAKTGAVTEVPYPNVTQVKGNNLTTGQWIAIGGVAAAVIILVLIYVGLSNN